jgi:hypothetical protein
VTRKNASNTVIEMKEKDSLDNEEITNIEKKRNIHRKLPFLLRK